MINKLWLFTGSWLLEFRIYEEKLITWKSWNIVLKIKLNQTAYRLESPNSGLVPANNLGWQITLEGLEFKELKIKRIYQRCRSFHIVLLHHTKRWYLNCNEKLQK